MANCYKIIKKYSHFLNGDLKGLEKKQFEQHVNECPNCNRRLAQTKKLISHLGSLTKYKTSTEFDIVLRSKLRSEINRGKSIFHFFESSTWGRIPVYATCILLLVATGIFVDRLFVNTPQQSVQLQPLGLQTTNVQPVAASMPSKDKRVKMKNFVLEQYPGTTLIDKTDSINNALKLINNPKFVVDSIHNVNTFSNSRSLFRPANATIRF